MLLIKKQIDNNLKRVQNKLNIKQEKAINTLNIYQSRYMGNALLTTLFLYSCTKKYKVSANCILNREKTK